MKRPTLIALLIIVATILAYLPAIHGAPIWDDKDFVFANPLVHAPDGLYRFWFTTQPEDYWPITYSVFWVQWRLFEANTIPYHAFNIGLHALNALLLWLILRRLGLRAAPLAALLFALHPVNVESVAWMFQAKTLLATSFGFGAILSYLEFEDGRRRWYALAVFLFVLGLLSKTSVAMFPFVILGLAWWKYERLRTVDLLRAAPFFVAALILGLVSVWFHTLHYPVGSAIVRDDGFFARLAGAGWAIWFYLFKAVLPQGLSFIYPRWTIDPTSVQIYVPLLLAVAGACLLWWKRKSAARPYLLAYGYFVLTLFPVLGFVDIPFMQFSFVADHWAYVSIVAPCAVVAAVLFLLARRIADKPAVTIATSLVLVLPLFGLTWHRAGKFTDEITIYEDTISKNPSAVMARINLGKAYVEQKELPKAIAQFEAVLELNPTQMEALSNLGSAYANTGKPEDAAASFRKALAIDPTNVSANYNLGNLMVMIKKYPEAAKHYETVVQVDPDHYDAHNNLANVLVVLTRYEEALKHYQAAKQINPNDQKIHYNLGKLLVKMERSNEAIEPFQKALKLQPNMVMAQLGIAYAHALNGRKVEAIEAYEKALETIPPSSDMAKKIAEEVKKLSGSRTSTVPSP